MLTLTTLLCAALGRAAPAQTLSQLHPGDAGVASHPAVLFADDFEQGVEHSRDHWANASRPDTLESSADHHPLSPGNRSLLLRGPGSGSYLYHRLPAGHDQLFLRYYIRYGGDTYHHAGAYLGGYLPPTDWPQGDAGLKGIRPNGDRLIQIAFEPTNSGPSARLDFYLNWIDMKGIDYRGLYYGRSLLADRPQPLQPGRWQCVEIMTKLNSAPDSRDGELALWIDGVQIAHFRPGEPRGRWNEQGGWRFDDSAPPFEGFLWRDTPDLTLNWIKVQNYDSPHPIWIDDLVLATQPIGPIVPPDRDAAR